MACRRKHQRIYLIYNGIISTLHELYYYFPHSFSQDLQKGYIIQVTVPRN